MFLLRICLMAWRALRTNLLRSLLATFGVIIGVAAVISAMSILEGMRKEVMRSLSTFGSDQIYVTPPQPKAGGRIVHKTDTLKLEDADAIVSGAPAVVHAVPLVASGVVVKHGSINKSYSMLGTTEAYTAIHRYNVERGRFLNGPDVVGENKVVVLGYKVAKDLFGQADPMGFRIKIRGQGFLVIGVMEKKGLLGMGNADTQMIVPVTTAMRRVLGVKYVSSIVVQAADSSTETMERCKNQVKAALRREHRLRLGDELDFDLFTQEEALKRVQQITELFAVVLYSIAGISLVVGGIGIMNIMLVSVTERTREIGVRMAVGAQRWDILRQFLIESSTISLLGGGFGILLGLAFNNLLENVTLVLTTYTPLRVVLYAVTMAILVGMCSGIYPAYKASRLDPVEALRYE